MALAFGQGRTVFKFR